MKFKSLLLIVMGFIFILHPFSIQGSETQKRIIYFYSSTCSECAKSTEFLEDFKAKNKDISIIKYNISTKEGLGLFTQYCENYNISEDSRYVPLVFISKTALIGLDNIKLIGNEVENLAIYNTPYLSYDDSIFLRGEGNQELTFLGVFFAGIVNGLNPCSFAMFLFLFSLITLNKKQFWKISIVFILSKFVIFFLLGTILFKFLSYLNISYIIGYVKIIMGTFIILLIILNFSDYISAKNNDYGKIKLQLPKKIRKFNHKLMKKIKILLDSKVLILGILFISIGVSLTEFMCTGQIYLVTIISMIQFYQVYNLKMIANLIVYNIALVLPLVLVTILLAKGKNVFSISEKLQKNMPIIKIINTVLLIFVFIFMLLT